MPASPNTITTFPVEYLDAIDEVLAGATFAGRYNVQGAEFVQGRQISVPDISFGTSPDPTDYNRFASESPVTIGRTVYTLDHDVEKVFYVDAAEAEDEPAIAMTNVVAEYERTVFGPYIDKDFFAKVKAQAKATGTTALTAGNIKGEIRKARSQFANASLSGGELYMSSDALALLEDATDRQWSNDTTITDTVGSYDGFQVFEVPSDRMDADFIAISGGIQTVRYITKRAATYSFAPGQHTKGDGWLNQFRWIFGTIVHKNKKPGIYANKATGN